eukprot:7685600-Pyramimonas_sp.AAC.1
MLLSHSPGRVADMSVGQKVPHVAPGWLTERMWTSPLRGRRFGRVPRQRACVVGQPARRAACASPQDGYCRALQGPMHSSTGYCGALAGVFAGSLQGSVQGSLQWSVQGSQQASLPGLGRGRC